MALDIEAEMKKMTDVADSDDPTLTPEAILGGVKSEPEQPAVVEEPVSEVSEPVEEAPDGHEPEYIAPETPPEATGADLSNDSDNEVQEPISTQNGADGVLEGNTEVVSAEAIRQIVQLADLFRAFDEGTHEKSELLLGANDEAETIAQALQQSILTLNALTALESVHEASESDGAFFLVSLDDELLLEIGRLIKVFMDVDVEYTDHISYCRSLEAEMRKMDDEFIQQTNTILELLDAAQPKE